ncbi:MAG TPA: patatin-like phospholipase family protein, partial [Candidatus Paceibacterota bacterium]|nr:patatin-like phospholipase family protein [Candidatus Paceibacterota bacterium]
MKYKERALICDGGGMQGSFMAGVLEEFYQSGIKGNFFDLYVGTSAGAFCCAYFLTGQVKEGVRIFNKYLPKGFIGWKNCHPYYDLEYL